jgi:hypothetical protein
VGIMSTKPMVFIDSDPRTLDDLAEDRTGHRLDPPLAETGAPCEDPVHDPALARPHRTPSPVPVGAGRSDRRARRPPGYFSPVLGPLAALAILEGYKLLGVIPADGSALSVMASGHVGAAIFAVLVVAVVVTVTRAGIGRRRPWAHRLVVTGAVAVAAATAVSVVIRNSVTTHVLGLADLALAATVLAALMAGEWRKRHADRAGRTAPHSSGRVPV